MFNVKIDLSALLGVERIANNLPTVISKAAEDLANATHQQIIKNAEKTLHTRKQMFLDGLSIQKEGDSTFIIVLDAKSDWIDTGFESRSMLPFFLKSSKAKTSKAGNKYLVIPMKGKNSAAPTPKKDLAATIKVELDKFKIPMQDIEKGANGKAKMGVLHKIAPKNSDIKGIQIKQHEKYGAVRKEIMVFRTASSAQGQDKWVHPGLPATNLMKQGLDWAEREWESVLKNKVLEEIYKLA